MGGGGFIVAAEQPAAALFDQVAAGLRGELDDHVVPVLDDLGALLYQQVRPPTELGRDVAGNGKDFPALIDRELGSDRRTAVLRAFHDEHPDAEAADNP